MDYLIGIDVGTTNVKAVIFNENGESVSHAFEPSCWVQLENGQCVFMPETLWDQVCRLIASAVNGLAEAKGTAARNNIVGIATTGMAESGVLLDAHGTALYPIIMWSDPCTRGMETWWNDTFGADRLLQITGQRAQFNFSVNKIMWTAKNHPEIWKKAAHWLCVPDYIAYKLSGVMAMDYSIACRTMLMNIYKKSWSSEICEHAGIPIGILPPLAASSTHLGPVMGEVALKCGLPNNTHGFVGGHDHICGALVVGVLKYGNILDSSGTAEQFLTVPDNAKTAKKRCAQGFNLGTHVADDLYYMSGALPSSGKTVDWYLREFPVAEGTASSSPGANGLIFLPNIEGGSSPKRDPRLSGAFCGIRSFHTRADFMQAVYEGLCFELKTGISNLLSSDAPDRIVVTGGGTRNKTWIQTKSNILAQELIIPKEYQSTAMGAALLAGIGIGIYSDAQAAFHKTFRTETHYVPEKDFDYGTQYEKYKRVSELCGRMNLL